MTQTQTPKKCPNHGINRARSAGFTLVEAMVAIVVLAFGLVSIANLSVVATSTNAVANRSSAATMLAAQQMEVLRSRPFAGAGGLVADATAQAGIDTLNVQTAGFSNLGVLVQGVGLFDTTWRLQPGANANVLFIQVRSEPRGFRGRSARAEFTTMRTCAGGTTQGCPL